MASVFLQREKTHLYIFIAILVLGIFARVWEFGALPPGLNQDEASIALEAYDLLHFGVDRNGISFPVNFISWGNGMDALYGYVLIPFVAFGLNPVTTRLPSLAAGILSIPLIYYVALKILGRAGGLLAAFVMAISPWHIVLSRWGINGNILPFLFLAGFALLLRSKSDNHVFIVATIFFALCFYTYAVAFIAVSFFLASAIPILLFAKRVRLKTVLWGLLIFGLIVTPIALFVLINTLKLDTIHLGAITVPRLPAIARYQSETALFSQNPIAGILENLRVLLTLVIGQTDGLVWNTVDPYGYFYSVTFPFALAGAILLITARDSERAPERWLLLCWLGSALLIGVNLYANVNRTSLIFIPLLLCISNFLVELGQRSQPLLAVFIMLLLVGFMVFTRDYHSETFQQRASKDFFSGLLPALEFARQAGGEQICITDSVNMPYIFALFVERMNPREYLDDIDYTDPTAEFRPVRFMGRYAFGIDSCSSDARTVYVLTKEKPKSNIQHRMIEFGNYRVYYP